jgi:predicted ArsR family transcriptional regulator
MPVVSAPDAWSTTHTPPPVTAAQRAVLYAIRRRGGITVDQLAQALDITRSGARQHLAALSEAGLVEAGEPVREPGRRGRPEVVHHLTPVAEPLFPKAYGELTNQILGYLAPEAVDEVFERRRDERIAAASRRVSAHRTFPRRVAELAAILDEDGYLATFERVDDRTFLVTEHNCAILAVATEHPHACSSEIEFIRAVLPDADVERTTHMVQGAHACTYEIRRR